MATAPKKAAETPVVSIGAETKMDVLRKTAQIMSEQFGIDVVFKGDQACTDGRTIFVPSLPDDAPDELIDAIIGYIDHEVGHIRHTNFGERRPFKDADGRVQMTTNAIEDIRQEKLMCDEYRGVGLNLERSSNWVLGKMSKKWDTAEGPSELFKITALAMARSKALQGWHGFKEFCDKHEGDFAPILDALMDEIETWHTLPSTTAAFEACKRFLDKLDDLTGSSAPPPPPKGKSKGGKDAKPGKGKGGGGGRGGSGEEPAAPESKADDDIHEKDDEEPGDEGDGEEAEGDEDPDEDADPSAGEGEGEDDEAEEEGSAPDEGEGEEPGLPAAAAELAGRLSDAKGSKGGDGIHETMAGMICSGAAGTRGHRAYTTEFDRSVAPNGDGTTEAYHKAMEDIRPHVNSVYTVLTRTLVAEGRARVTFGLTEGRLATGSLAKLRVGDPGVFKKKRKGRDLNTYVEIVVDQSGSMSGRKIALAQQTCIVLSEALERVGVPFGIVGFTCGWHGVGLGANPASKARHDTLYREVASRSANGFARLEPLIEYVYKSADDSLAKSRPLLSLMTDQYMANNADGDSIMRIAKRLVKTRKENRKIMIVLSDGQPVAASGDGVPGDAHKVRMKSVSAMIKRTKGLEVIGIGIMADAVRSYYDHSVVVKSIDELPSVAMSELKGALLGSRS